MINNIKRGPLANALVLHDFQKDPVDLRGWFYYIEDWFKKGGLVPSRISGRAGKTVGFEREKKRLEKEDFKSIRDGVWIGALPPKVGTEMFDFIFAAHLYRHPRGTATMVLCWDSQLINFKRDYMETLIKGFYSYLEPSYGYGYQREFKFGPSFYPFGVLVGIDSFSEEANQITKWGNEYNYSDGNYKTGMLRDIYPINFLSKTHLSQKVGGTTLQNWIESTPQHGELQSLIEEQFWSWWVHEGKIPVVREELRPTGLLVCI